MNKLLIIISGILCYWNVLGQSQKFQVNGAARTYIFANELNIDQEIDSIGRGKSQERSHQKINASCTGSLGSSSQ